MKLPSLDQSEGLIVIVAGAALLYFGWRIVGQVRELAGGIGDAAGAAYDQASERVDQWAAGNQYAAPLSSTFNADHWRPAGVYVGSVLMFATGGTELKPEYRAENGGPGY